MNTDIQPRPEPVPPAVISDDKWHLPLDSILTPGELSAVLAPAGMFVGWTDAEALQPTSATAWRLWADDCPGRPDLERGVIRFSYSDIATYWAEETRCRATRQTRHPFGHSGCRPSLDMPLDDANMKRRHQQREADSGH